jgi:hypothetical protein
MWEMVSVVASLRPTNLLCWRPYSESDVSLWPCRILSLLAFVSPLLPHESQLEVYLFSFFFAHSLRTVTRACAQTDAKLRYLPLRACIIMYVRSWD